MDPDHIIHSGRLGPGQMIVADLDFHRFFENDEILRIYDTKRQYQDLIQLDMPLVRIRTRRLRRSTRQNSIACSIASATRAKTCA